MSEHDQVLYLNVGGEERRYVLHTPPGFTPDRPRPAVLMLDGRGGTPWTAMKSSQWSVKADAEDFLAVYPEARRLDPNGPQHFLQNPQMWNAGDGGWPSEDGPDDLSFIRAVIEGVCTKFAADPQRVFMAGFSNGATMAFRFAALESGHIAAIAPVGGHIGGKLPAPERPVPAIMLFGKRDPLSPFDGGPVELPWGRRATRPAARASFIEWARLLGLGAEPDEIEQLGGATRERFGPDARGAEVVFYAIDDLGHVWPGGHRLLPERLVGATCDRIRATDVIWDFFTRHPMP